MNSDQLSGLMKEAIKEAELSVPEDDRPHPKVGALLADEEGQILVRAHRGENGKGGHAEFLLLQKAREAGVDLAHAILFVTLEPCTRRSPDKTPCALRVVASGVRRAYIGTLDPNPVITGRGETYLSYHLDDVGRFPSDLVRQLRELNGAFFEQYRHEHLPVSSIYAAHLAEPESDNLRPKLVEYREGLLQQSMDLIVGSSDGIWIMAGDLSWYRELQIALLLATLDKREIRVICRRSAHSTEEENRVYETRRSAVLGLGAQVVELEGQLPLRGTIVGPHSNQTSIITIEDLPRLHGSLFRLPADGGIVALVVGFFEQAWRHSNVLSGPPLRIAEITEQRIEEALRKGVPMYRDLPIDVVNVSTDEIMPIATHLERFKLFRMSQLEVLRMRHALPWSASIVGSPWAITPPVIERLPDGRLVVIDGTHRLFGAISRGERIIRAVVVDNPSGNLPAQPLKSWDDVRIDGRKRPRSERYISFKPEEFRPIRKAFEDLAETYSNEIG